MARMKMKTVWGLFTLSISLIAATAARVAIYPGAPWTDTSGNSLQAHGGGLIKVGSVWYWFGENKIEDNSNFLSVNCYSSRDLGSWKFEGKALSPISGTNISSSNIVERPKVIYNKKTKKYVMYFHNDNSGYSLAMVGVATSETVNGQYQYQGSFQPLNSQSRDMGLFQDDDGSAYLLFASDNNKNFKIANLSSDYLSVSSLVHEFSNVNYEAGGIFKNAGQYFLVVSHTSGWSPNPNKYLRASSLSGTWTAEADLAPSATNTYSSQNAYDLQIAGAANTSYIYYGDRWISNALSASRYIWLPFQFDANGNPSLRWIDAWSINVGAGTWSTLPSTSYEAEAAGNTLSGGANISSCSMCSGGKDVTYLGMGSTLQFNNITGKARPYVILVTYYNNDSASRYLDISVNGGTTKNYTATPTNGMLGVLKLTVMLKAGKSNTVRMSNPNAYGPDIDRIAVVEQN